MNSSATDIQPIAASAATAEPWLEVLRRPGSMTRWVVIGTLLSLLVAWGSVAAALYFMRTDAVEADREYRANLARILQEQTVRVLAATDQAAKRLSDAVRDGSFELADIGRFANETGLAPAILTQLSLVGPDGRFRGSNLDPDGSKSGHVDLSTREHVRVHLAPAQAKGAPPVSPGGLFIGKPVLGKVSGKWTIQLSRRIDGADGRVLGVVVASLDPLYFEEIYRGVGLGTQGGVTLLGSDLTVRARVIGGRSVGMGSTIDPGAAGSPLVGEQGDYASRSRIDGVPRQFTYRRVADYPVYIVVGRSQVEALASWRDALWMSVALTALLTAALVGSAVLFAVGVRRLESTNRALQASEAQAQAANRAKTEFLAAVSHELRTPLTSIRGFAELMEMRLPDARHREQAGLIRKAAEYLNELLTEILDLVKVEAGAMQVDRRPVDPRPVVEGVATFFAVTAADKGLQLQTRFADDLPPAVLADELRLKQILNNLMSNAFKFTEAGSVTIEVDRDQRHMRLHVVDTGPGIPPHLHETIFERFRQGDGRVSYQHGGTGLGLALSRALVELMGGTLTVQSAVGAGSRFTVALPLQP
ncbi:MAG: ATP-binding protein [Rubrivivax sp.]